MPGSTPSGASVRPAVDHRQLVIWTDGSLAQISDIITKGVAQPKQYRAPMPPMGGAGFIERGSGGGVGLCLGRDGHKAK